MSSLRARRLGKTRKQGLLTPASAGKGSLLFCKRVGAKGAAGFELRKKFQDTGLYRYDCSPDYQQLC